MTEAVAKLARLVSNDRETPDTLAWHRLRIDDTAALRARLAAALAPATANKHLAALRGVLRQAREMGRMSDDEFRAAIDLPAVHGQPPKTARILGADELRRLVATCEVDASPAGARDAALFALLLGAGLRRSEVVALDLSDYDRATGEVVVRATASRPARHLSASRESRLALEAWIGRRGVSPGPLFAPVNKGGRIDVRRLSEQAIYVACRKRAAEARLPPVSPEDLRRSLHRSRRRELRTVRPAADRETPLRA